MRALFLKIQLLVPNKHLNLFACTLNCLITSKRAGWLIEQAGWKGKWLGNVRMHEKQALVLTTNGQASYQEVVDLKDKIITNIKERFGVTLEPEPQVFP